MKRRSKFIWALILVLGIAFIGFSIWAYSPLGPMPQALTAIQSSAEVRVGEDPWLVFQPMHGKIDTGLIIYPGGRVDPRSYAPAAHALAEDGYLVIIPAMPFNLAVFGWQKAGQVINEYPTISNWVISGHSLGGTMAAKYAISDPDQIDGIILWAAYPASSDDLSASSLESMSIYATDDGLISNQEIDESRKLMPENTSWVKIDGGNHSQFGWYGDQPGDNPASISREIQQQIIIESTKDLLTRIK
ncbi:MAG: alpha/beta hydrolase [Anaerolineales bacterium]